MTLIAGLEDPVSLFRCRWNFDGYTYGGWAFQSTATLDKEPEILAEPLPSQSDPRLLFAGEATDQRFLGNLLGARSVTQLHTIHTC